MAQTQPNVATESAAPRKGQEPVSAEHKLQLLRIAAAGQGMLNAQRDAFNKIRATIFWRLIPKDTSDPEAYLRDAIRAEQKRMNDAVERLIAHRIGIDALPSGTTAKGGTNVNDVKRLIGQDNPNDRRGERMKLVKLDIAAYHADEALADADTDIISGRTYGPQAEQA